MLAVGVTAIVLTGNPASAYEFGYPGWQLKPGVALDATAGAPPPGLYMFQQFFTYQATIVGPGAPHAGGAATPIHVAAEATGLVWVPGWTFLGATYDAVIVEGALTADAGAPININPAGVHNTYLVPAELSWKLGDSGFFVKAGLGVYIPDGSISGPSGLTTVGNPWWTLQPELLVSYIKDGWSLTANFFYETNTRNTETNYKTGDILHAEFAATRTFGKWTVGPVAYYVGQVTNDSSSSFYNYAINSNRFDLWAAGLKVGYDFGPVNLSVWALDEFSAHASGGTAALPGLDSASITKGYSAFVQLNFRLWGPDAPQPSGPAFHK